MSLYEGAVKKPISMGKSMYKSRMPYIGMPVKCKHPGWERQRIETSRGIIQNN